MCKFKTNETISPTLFFLILSAAVPKFNRSFEFINAIPSFSEILSPFTARSRISEISELNFSLVNFILRYIYLIDYLISILDIWIGGHFLSYRKVRSLKNSKFNNVFSPLIHLTNSESHKYFSYTS